MIRAAASSSAFVASLLGGIVVVYAFGIAGLAPGQGDAVTLMRHADLALYEAKGEGRNTCRFFEERLLQAAEERQRLQSDLAVALPQLYGTFPAPMLSDPGSR